MTANHLSSPVTYEVHEIVIERYAVVCPNCDEWHEHDESQTKKKQLIECICGAMIKVVP